MKLMRGRVIEFLVLLAIAIGASPAGAALWNWSTTAGSNDAADPSINWREGMAPSAVNDSARAMMAVIAVNNKDTSGQITSAGTSSALTLATNTVFPNLAALAGQQIAFVAGTTNAVGSTLNIDGTGALPIYIDGVNGAAPANTITAGGIYTVTQVASLYRLHSVYGNPYNIPLGGMMPYTLTTVPNANFVFAAGQCISTTTYATYWVALGSPASGTCSGGQFRIIDMSGRVPAGLDTMPGFSAVNRLTSSVTGCGTAMTTVGAFCVNGSESHTLTTAELAAHSHGITDPGHTHVFGGSFWVGTVNGTSSGGALSTPTSTALLTGVPTGSSTTGISISNAGGGGAHAIVQPTIGVTYILRVI